MGGRMTLTILGLASLVFVAAFTLRSYHAGVNPRSAIIEAWANIVIGFAINYVANLFILPLVGASFTHTENFMMGWLYTAISILRQYAIRRWFQEGLHAFAEKVSKA